ncbi:MAG: septum formation protein Maf [Actinobacteria bacterium HGW-Actinobacteria-7]|nr:MAG: septum formation protein Maf [Actinobacteria bacterium HGW-Actinobacteria-7]
MDKPVLLASQSPRRRRLMAWLGVPFETAAVDTPEELDTPLASNPVALAASLAAEKAIASRAEGLAPDALVLCFDTIVVHDGRVLGKPADVADAWEMLRSLSGNTHQVVTGVALMCPGDREPRTFSAVTDVEMKTLTDCQIEAWMAAGTFLGCAGAYNIEAQVASVTDDECYQNVAGLPLCHLYAALKVLPDGCVPDGLHSPIAACDEALGRHCRLGPRLAAQRPPA